MDKPALSISSFNAHKVASWIVDRGGVAVWQSLDLSNPGREFLTPAHKPDGTCADKPHWSCANNPTRIVRNLQEVEVTEDKEVRRFHVAVRRGSQGFSFKLTDGSSRRVRAAVEKAGEGAYHVFDYETQEAVILAPVSRVNLYTYVINHPIAQEVQG